MLIEGFKLITITNNLIIRICVHVTQTEYAQRGEFFFFFLKQHLLLLL